MYIYIKVDNSFLSFFCRFGIVASKLSSCSLSLLTNLSSSCKKGLRPFSSKVFAKPLSCLHFGHVFVNAAWPLRYQRLTHDSQATTEEQERQQINGGFGGQTLQMVQEKLSSASFNSPIGICRLDEILKIFATCSFRFLISESISDETGHGDADLFLLEGTTSEVSTSSISKLCWKFSRSPAFTQNTFRDVTFQYDDPIKVMKTENIKFRLRKLNIILMPICHFWYCIKIP